MSTRLRRGLLVALVVLVALVYAPGIGGGYAFDDYANIVDNPALDVGGGWLSAAFSSPSSDLQRPLAMLTFAFNRATTGADPAPMKLVNIGLHLLNLVLTYLLARRLLRRWRDTSAAPVAEARIEAVALAIAALWGLAAINLMAVLFIVQRMEALAHTFVLLGLIVLLELRARRHVAGGYPAAMVATLVVCAGAGVLAKESAILLPLYAFLIEAALWHFKRADGQRDRALLGLYAAVLLLPAVVGAAWLLPKMLAPGAYAGRDFSLVERLLTETRVLVDYLHWIVIPDLSSLSLYHDDYPISRGLLTPPATLACAIALVALAVVAWVVRRRRPLFALGVALYFAAHAITATIIPLELVYEHRNYGASSGAILAAADVLVLMPGLLASARIALAMLLLAWNGVATHLRAREWSDPARFAVTEAAKHPNSPRATYALGRTYIVLGAYDADSPYTERAFPALEQARAAPAATLLPEQALIILAARTGRPVDPAWWESAIAKLQHRRATVQDVAALAALQQCLLERRCDLPHERMLELILAAVTASGEAPDVLSIYSDFAFNVLQDPRLALDLSLAVVEKAPGAAQYRVNLVKLLIALGRYDEARAQIAALREIGRLGQNRTAADLLQQRLDAAQAQQSRTAP